MSRIPGFVVWCELVCDSCAKTTAGVHINGYTIPRREMRAEAMRHGWIFHDGSTYCGKNCAGREGAYIEDTADEQ